MLLTNWLSFFNCKKGLPFCQEQIFGASYLILSELSMKHPSFLWNCSLSFLWGLRSTNIKLVITSLLFNISTTPIMAIGCQQCLPLSVIQLKGKHCRKPHCHNGVVDTFFHSCLNFWMVIIESCVRNEEFPFE